MTAAHDLIDEALISVRDAAGIVTRTTLPGAISGLCAGSVADFPRLRTHQFDPWMMFLTQLGAIALHRAGKRVPPEDEKSWRKLLLSLTEQAHEPWCLRVDDLKKPAFFQSPVPERDGLGDWDVSCTPDTRDVLVVTRGHDLKRGRIAASDVESWAFALCLLQTTQGYPNAGYHQIARMNGGFGSRPRIGLANSLALSPRFRRDLGVLSDAWPSLEARGYASDGIALTWVEPWNGRTSLPMKALCPHFIEVCQRLRLTANDNDGLWLRFTTSETMRCRLKDHRGDVGDPWIPVGRDGGALTVPPAGFHYRLAFELLVGSEFVHPAAQCHRKADAGTMLLIFNALARGKSKTEGLHSRLIPIGGPTRRRLEDPDACTALGQRGRTAIERAKLIRTKVLFPAVKLLGEPKDDLDSQIDRVFFDALFSHLEESDATAMLSWDRQLVELARNELATMIQRVPLGDARFYRTVSDAERVFEALVRKHFPDVTSVPISVQEAP